ncbi:MAG: site-2 protease family protein [Patescibacteria group bacterium]
MTTFFWSVALFILIVMPLIVIHEWGHYIVARFNGIAVKAFSVGFGTELFGWNNRHGTRFKLSLLPLGGYVEFLKPEEQKETRAYEHTAFDTSNVWARIAVVAAGPIANIMCAFALFSFFFYATSGGGLSAQTNGKYTLAAAVERSAQEIANVTVLTFGTLGDVGTGEKSVRETFSGPVGIAHIAERITSKYGWIGFLFLSAHISLALGIMNLLPIPILDGGYLFFYVVEALSGRPLKKKWLTAVNIAGIVLLLALFAVTTYGDIIRILS